MPMPLREVLKDRSLAGSEPRVLAGRHRLGRLVRWVHTSEVLDIASLLRGGELLLVGGVSLATASEQERREYIAALADREVAGIAIETGARLPVMPEELVDEATRRHLPLIELRKVVRFVEVTQSINGLLVNESVRRLQLADQVSHALAAELAAGGEVAELMNVLGRETGAHAVLSALTGEVIAESATADDALRPVARVSDRPIVAMVMTAGVTVATLSLHPGRDSDLLMIDAARDRAPEALGLALLRSRPLSRVQRDAHEMLTLALSGTRSSRRFADLAERLGIDRHDAYLGVIARFEPSRGPITGIEPALRRSGRTTISEVVEGTHVSVVALNTGRDSIQAARLAVIEDLLDAPLTPGVQVGVGPGSRTLEGIGRCLREAGRSLDVMAGAQQGVFDAAEVSVQRFMAAVDRPDLVSELIEEQLGDLLALDRRRHGQLFETLHMLLRHLGSKTDTAAALHLQRQSLYQRLDKIFAAVGDPPPGSARWGALMLAVELEAARRADDA